MNPCLGVVVSEGNNGQPIVESVVVPVHLRQPKYRSAVLVPTAVAGETDELREIDRASGACAAAEAEGGRGGARRESIQAMSLQAVAKKLAVLPQVLVAPEAITVEELVGYGRHPQRQSMLGMSDEDREAIELGRSVLRTWTTFATGRSTSCRVGSASERGLRLGSPRGPT